MVTEPNIHNDYLQKEMFCPSCVHAYLHSITLYFSTYPVKKKRDIVFIIEHLTHRYKKYVINHEQKHK